MGMSCCKAKCWKIGLAVVVGIAVLGWVVMALWNWLMPSLFSGVNEIGYLQALGVLVLCKILFGGFRHGCHGRWHRSRWESMTPEEREKFKAGMHGCSGGKNKPDGTDTVEEQ
jgi:hypothetical protein